MIVMIIMITNIIITIIRKTMIGTIAIIIYIYRKTNPGNLWRWREREGERELYRPHCNLTGMMVRKGNHPHVRPYFRLVQKPTQGVGNPGWTFICHANKDHHRDSMIGNNVSSSYRGQLVL
jgi:hypothetical protein